MLADKLEEDESEVKVFNIPEVVEILISFLDPASILHLAGTVSSDEEGNPEEKPLCQSLQHTDEAELAC